MKIFNYMNNTNSIMEKNTDKVQKGNSQTNVNAYKARLREISWHKATKSNSYHICSSRVNAADE